ncbi:hypothetical protein [Anaerohalosphaera lusitana]|nr:hypothetical protein [Anaerohalosphaera lusitana]
MPKSGDTHIEGDEKGVSSEGTRDMENNEVISVSNIDAGQGGAVAKLPNGVRFELIALCEHPSEGKKWWRPDGTLLGFAPHEKLNDSDRYNDVPFYEVVFRIEPDNGTTCKIDTSGRTAGFSGPHVIEGRAEGVVNGFEDAMYSLVPVAGGDDPVNLTFLLGDESGWEWHAKVKSPVHKRGVITSRATLDVSVGENRKVIAHVAHRIENEEVRVIARNNSGKVFYPGMSGKGRTWINIITAEFDHLTVDDAAAVELQVQEFQPVTFQNVSLQPGLKTDVEVVLEREEESGDAKRPAGPRKCSN